MDPITISGASEVMLDPQSVASKISPSEDKDCEFETEYKGAAAVAGA